MANKVENNELIVVQSAVGVGKTLYTISKLGYEALKQKLDVLHLTLEDEMKEVYGRYIIEQIVEKEGKDFKVDIKDLFGKNDLDEYGEEVLDKAAHELTDSGEELGRLRVAVADLDKESIKEVLEDVYRAFHFDLLIVDPYDFMSESNQKEFLTLKDTFKGEGFLAVAVKQLPKEEESKLLKGEKTDYKENKDLMKEVGTIYTLLQDEEMKKGNELKILEDVNGDIVEKEYKIDYGNITYSK